MAQQFGDYEVVVANNTGDPATTEVVEYFRAQSQKIREVRSEKLLSMSDNWEFGLNACTGEYVTVLGDDDGLMPEALSYADLIIGLTGTRLLSWPCHEYFWPGAATYKSQNHLKIVLGEENMVGTNSREKLVSMYAYTAPFHTYPMIYNGFVHRDVMAAVQRRCGIYFASDNPDVFSAIASLYFTDVYVSSGRPLGVRGTSRHSNGNAMIGESNRREEALKQFQEEAGKQGRGVHPMVFESPIIDIPIAGTFMTATDLLFPDDPELRIDIRLLIDSVLTNAAQSPDIYDLSVDHAHKLARMHNIPAGSYVIPPRPPPAGAIVRTGPLRDERGNVTALVINGGLCGVRTVADATRFITAATELPLV